MEAQFWLDRWNEGKIGFHKEEFQEKLLEYFPTLNFNKGQRVLVPLCGKTKDLIWLHTQGLDVDGIELSEKAVESFFLENNLTEYKKERDLSFIHYSVDHLRISCGNFLNLNPTTRYDFIYDRASLIALPQEMRDDYARVISNALLVGGRYLLIALEYDQTLMQGPPFSIDENEVKRLYGENFNIRILDTEVISGDSSRISVISDACQKVYVLTKKL